jgi:adenylate cyclase class 2
MKPSMAAAGDREIEIKLPAPTPDDARRRLEQAGFRVAEPRSHEFNTAFDTPENRLRRGDMLLRLRISGDRNILTFKGPSEAGRHKIREEIEVEMSDAAAFARILEHAGFQPVFRYEKYRTEYELARAGGRAMLDETPAGVFIELEGSPEWIDDAAGRLGFSERDYIKATYAELHLHSAAGRTGQRDMLFERSEKSQP